MIENHSLQVTRTAHYYTIGHAGPGTRHCWIAFHGYGQLASRLIHKLDVLAGEDTFILAPEGLSRFYWGGVAGPVAASWMTSADRLDEIADYAAYLQQLYDHYIPQMAEDIRIHLLGFSQGCATAVRWAMAKFPRFHDLVLWGGLFPEDLDYGPHRDYWSSKRLFWVYGTEDEYLTQERLQFHLRLIEEQNLKVEIVPFKGGHTIDREVLKSLLGYGL